MLACSCVAATLKAVLRSLDIFLNREKRILDVVQCCAKLQALKSELSEPGV